MKQMVQNDRHRAGLIKARAVRTANKKQKPEPGRHYGPHKIHAKGDAHKAREPYKLKPNEAIFVAESLKPGVSKARAAQAAGLDYIPQGKNIRKYRSDLIQKQLEAADVTTERTLMEIARIAYWDPRKMFDENGDLIPITELDYDTAAAIAGLEVERRTEGRGDAREVYHVLKIKIASKVAALDLLTRLDLEAQRKGASGPMQAAPVFNVQFVKPQLNNGNGDPTVQ
jgi:hypothetical protein